MSPSKGHRACRACPSDAIATTFAVLEILFSVPFHLPRAHAPTARPPERPMQHPFISLLPLPSPGGTAVGCVVHIPIAQANPLGIGGNKVPGTLELLVSYLPFVLVVVAAWLLLYRPERERMRRQQELLGSLKKNDRVVTSSGIYGTVANVERDADRVFLRVDDSGNVKIAVTLASIAKVLDASTEPSTTAP